MSTLVVVPAQHIPHAGLSTTLLQLKDIGDFTIGGAVYATCMSPNKLFIVAVEQSGTIHVLQRREAEDTVVVHHSVIHTKYGLACFVAIDDDARSVLLIDHEERCHVFWSYQRVWSEESLGVTIGLIKHAAHTFRASLEDDDEDETVEWFLCSNIDQHTYRFTRHPRWLWWWRGFVWLPY